MTQTYTAATQATEYQTVATDSALNELARDGWTLHSAVPCGGNLWYVMQRPAATPTPVPDHPYARTSIPGQCLRCDVPEGRHVELVTAEKDRLVALVRQAQEALIHLPRTVEARKVLDAIDAYQRRRPVVVCDDGIGQ